MIDRTFTIETVSLDSSQRNWCVDAYQGLVVGRLVGVRPCEDKKASQSWQFDDINQLHLVALKSIIFVFQSMGYLLFFF